MILGKISYINAIEEILLVNSFGLILSTIGTLTYKLAKFLLLFLTPLTQNEYTVTDSLHFAEEICKQDTNLYMASLEVDFLFTNIRLDKTIDICIDSLYKDDDNNLRILKDVSRNLLKVATKGLFICLRTNTINKLMVWL